MTVLLWVAVVLAGLAVALAASRRAVHHVTTLAFGLRVPPFLIGITLVALGTDMPEIANSIIASLAGHGDVNVGDSVGSAATQATLVLGLLPLLGGAFVAGRSRVGTVGALTALALALGGGLVADGRLSRSDGLVLVLSWLVASALVWRAAPPAAEPALAVPARRKGYHALAGLAALAVVGAGAGGAVAGFVQLAELLGVPEYVITFFGASLGTSLPELLVVVTALRAGERDLALGDALGASLVDSTLSIGIGPLLAPTAVTASLAVRGAFGVAVVVALVTVLLTVRKRHDWRSALILLALYAAFYPLMLAV